MADHRLEKQKPLTERFPDNPYVSVCFETLAPRISQGIHWGRIYTGKRIGKEVAVFPENPIYIVQLDTVHDMDNTYPDLRPVMHLERGFVQPDYPGIDGEGI